MGITIKHVTSTKIIPRTRSQSCRAMEITQAIDSGAWKGRKCFLIGGGPSLRGFDYSQLKGHATIAVNKSFLAYPQADIMFAMDEQVWTGFTHSPNPEWIKYRPQWQAYEGIKLFYRAQGTAFQFDDSVYFIKALNRNCLSLDLQAGIYGGTNSGYGALMLAIALESTSIGLLGYDFTCGATNDKTHHHDGYAGQDAAQLGKKLVEFMKCFIEIAPAIEAIGVDVCNLYLDSDLECFRKDTVENFLGVV